MKVQRRYQVPKSLEVRDDSGSGLPSIAGVPIVYNQETLIQDWYGEYREVIREGACANTLGAGGNIRALAHHDSQQVLGTTKHGTLTLTEEANQVSCLVSPPDTQAGRDLVENIKRGDIEGMSFGFFVKRDRWTFSNDKNVPDLREILEIELIEVSFVTFPAYAGTSAALRSVATMAQQEDSDILTLGRLLRQAKVSTVNGETQNQMRSLLQKISSMLPEAISRDAKADDTAPEVAPDATSVSAAKALEFEHNFLSAEIEEMLLDESLVAG